MRKIVLSARWIVDSTGRSSLLKRKLGLQKDINHDINSSWFRLDAVIDIDDWSDNLDGAILWIRVAGALPPIILWVKVTGFG